MLNVSVKTSRLTLLKAKRSFMWKGRVEVMMNKDSDDIRELGLYLLEDGTIRYYTTTEGEGEGGRDHVRRTTAMTDDDRST